MAIGKPRGKDGKIPVYVYDPATKKKKYVGSADNLRAARLLESKKHVELTETVGQRQGKQVWTVAGWAQHWLDNYHGPNTRRPEDTTFANNERLLRRFIAMYGGRKLSGITFDEAQAWATLKPHEAKALGAMFNDAYKKRHVPENVWAHVDKPKSRGRADITPLTVTEVRALADFARSTLGVYGDEFASFITFLAWTGMRPGEACGLEWPEVDLARGELLVHWQRRNDGRRVPYSKTKKDRRIVLADPAVEALAALPRRPGGIFKTATGKEMKPNSIRYPWATVRGAFVASLPESHWMIRRLQRDADDELVPYELRHHCGSYLADQGLTAREIAAHLGNTPDVCEVYIHDYDDRVRDRIRAAFGSNVREIRGIGSGATAANDR